MMILDARPVRRDPIQLGDKSRAINVGGSTPGSGLTSGKVTEGVSGHAADFVAVVLTRHSHGEHEGRARVWTYRNLDQLPFFC